VNPPPDLSIIIPSFNEEQRLPDTLRKIAAYVRERRPDTEVIVVDDGSTDKTAAVARSYQARIPLLRVLSNTHDVAIGSRAVDRSLIETHQSAFRESAGIVFNRIVRIILRLPFVDTQCGFKAFRRERCRIIFEQQTIERFGFDPELLYLARHHGLSTIEVPVRWAHSPATKVSMLKDSLQMFLDVFVIRWNALRGRYRQAD